MPSHHHYKLLVILRLSVVVIAIIGLYINEPKVTLVIALLTALAAVTELSWKTGQTVIK